MNVKRIAWESRPVEHRSVPAAQRMAGEFGAEAAAAVAGAGAGASASAAGAVTAVPAPTPSVPPVAASATPDGSYRARIAELVERVLAEHGIARGSEPALSAAAGPDESSSASAPAAAAAPETPRAALSPGEVASEIAGRVFSASAAPATRTAAAAAGAAAERPAILESPKAQSAAVSPFVSESDVRRALTRQEKIYIGPKTIVTPSARDLGVEHEVFVETEGTTKA
jgi:hypothetical protein